MEVRREDVIELTGHEAREGPAPSVSSIDKLTEQEIVRQALEIYLPDYKFIYHPDGAKATREFSSILLYSPVRILIIFYSGHLLNATSDQPI